MHLRVRPPPTTVCHRILAPIAWPFLPSFRTNQTLPCKSILSWVWGAEASQCRSTERGGLGQFVGTHIGERFWPFADEDAPPRGHHVIPTGYAPPPPSVRSKCSGSACRRTPQRRARSGQSLARGQGHPPSPRGGGARSSNELGAFRTSSQQPRRPPRPPGVVKKGPGPGALGRGCCLLPSATPSSREGL